MRSPGEVLDDLAECFHASHDFRGDGGKVRDFFFKRGKYFHPFDGVDSKIGLDVHVHGEHFRWIARKLTDHIKHDVF